MPGDGEPAAPGLAGGSQVEAKLASVEQQVEAKRAAMEDIKAQHAGALQALTARQAEVRSLQMPRP